MANKVSDVVADFLKVHEIEVAFGIIGSANSHIFDSIQRLGYTKIICLHHEQAVVMAMSAYYRASGKLAVALVTAGGGASNSITGILSAWADSIPGIIISGQEPSRYLDKINLRMFGTQGFKSSEMVKSITKYSKIILESDSIYEELKIAYIETLSKRPGPVWLEIPFDIQSHIIEKRSWVNENENNQIDGEVIIKADFIFQELLKSQRPVLVLGNGIKLAKSETILYQVLEKLKIPVFTTWSSLDLIHENYEYYYGRFGLYGQRCANFIIQQSDLVIGLGTRFAIPQIGYNVDEFAPKAKIIAVDIDESELKKYDRFIGIHANVKDILNEFLNQKPVQIVKNDWILRCNKIKKENPLILKQYHENKEYINSYLFLNSFSKKLGKSDIVVTDMGTALLSGHQVMEANGYKMFTSQGLGEMGVGLPYAIGAAMTSENSKVHCLNCDGGMMMNLQELQTIKHINKKIKIIIFNNDGYLMIKHTQKMLFDGRYSGVNPETGVSLPDFSKISSAFGFKYLALKDMIEFDNILELYFNSEEPLILEVFMDPEQDFIPKVKGIPVAQSSTILSPPIEEMSPLLSFEFISKMMGDEISQKSIKIDRSQ